jgi:hypothetical protein
MRLRTFTIASLFACVQPCLADAPPFDRPGIGFASAVLPVGSFDWEQGLPDLERDSGGGERTTTSTADTLFRFGLTSTLELQLSGSPWNRTTIHAPGVRMHTDGAGDTALGLKWAPALASKQWTLAFLGSVSFDTGSAAFTNGRTVTSLGAAATRDLGDGRSLELYANDVNDRGANTWTLSANYGFPIHGNFGGYLEAARVAGGGTSSSLAGAGITWLLHDRVQFDLYADGGLTSRSPDLLAGFGISVFWK